MTVTRELIRERAIYVKARLSFKWASENEIVRMPLYRMAESMKVRTPWDETCPDIGVLDAAAWDSGWVRREFESHRQGSTHFAYVRRRGRRKLLP